MVKFLANYILNKMEFSEQKKSEKKNINYNSICKLCMNENFIIINASKKKYLVQCMKKYLHNGMLGNHYIKAVKFGVYLIVGKNLSIKDIVKIICQIIVEKYESIYDICEFV